MNTTKSEFQKRRSEINIYFETLEMLDRGECRIVCQTLIGEEEIMHIDSELSKILKANGFILLYNLCVNVLKKYTINIDLDLIYFTSISNNVGINPTIIKGNFIKEKSLFNLIV